MMERTRGLALTMVVALVFGFAAEALAQRGNDRNRNRQEREEIEALVKLVDGVMAGTAGPTDITFNITPYFLKSQEARTFVPFSLEVTGAPAKDMALYVRVVDPAVEVDPKKRAEYPWDDIHFVPAAQVASSPARLNRVFMAVPGTYDVYLAMKERAPEKPQRGATYVTGVYKTSITVPDLAAEFTTSSVLVTDTVNMLTAPISPEEQRERPFVFGAQELIPALDEDFKKSEELNIFFQVYNPGLDAGGKPDLVMEYNFHRTEDGEEKFFNKTNPQNINASNLPPQFDPAVFPVPGGITVPLATFPEGDFRLEIKIIDKAAGRELVRNVKFTVTAS
ncbi:MAG: hypothetical protein Q8L86_00840 [Vicinamibacterales bacterium]|nr:hypothetical protein [Vicinamibacterales bacterium]